MAEKGDIYLDNGVKPQWKRSLFARELQSPVFVSMYGISTFDGPDTDADHTGRMTIKGLHGETLRGYRCQDIKAMYQWTPNGKGKGFTHTLMCRFEGGEPHFNHMIRFMCNRAAEYVVLLPRQKKPYLVIGYGNTNEIEIAQRSVEHQTFVMEFPAGRVPFPYYEGPLSIEDCTEPELMEQIY